MRSWPEKTENQRRSVLDWGSAADVTAVVRCTLSEVKIQSILALIGMHRGLGTR